MSGSQLHQAPATSVYDEWKVEVYKATGHALKDEGAVRAKPGVRPTMPDGWVPTTLPKVEMRGKSAPESRIGEKLAESLFGNADRRQDTYQNDDEIRAMTAKGQAAPVEINGQGNRKLNGNFFSVADHNLKDNDGEVDISRPVVLLLTGSGGSAENQGFDVAKFYAENGASVMSVNYAGFGTSETPDGTPSELSMKQDAQSMLQHLVKLGYDPDKIIIHGYSLGAAVAAELQQSYEKAGTKFRGTVQDRPMLSTSHGVETNSPNWPDNFPIVGGTEIGLPAKKVIGKITSSQLGDFDGESAVKRLDPKTPLVITTDKGAFAARADELRGKLKRRGREVDGAASGQGHEDHAAMLEANGDALRKLVADDDPEKYPPDASNLVAQCSNSLNPVAEIIENTAKEIAKLQTRLQEVEKAGPDDRAALAADILKLRDETQASIGKLVDVMNYLPELPNPDGMPAWVGGLIKTIKSRARTAHDACLQATADLQAMLRAPALRDIEAVKGASSATRQEIDLLVVKCCGFLSEIEGPAKDIDQKAVTLEVRIEAMTAEENELVQKLNSEEKQARLRRPASKDKIDLANDILKLRDDAQKPIRALADLLKYLPGLPRPADAPESSRALVKDVDGRATAAKNTLSGATIRFRQMLSAPVLKEVKATIAPTEQETDLALQRVAEALARLKNIGGPAAADEGIKKEFAAIRSLGSELGIDKAARSKMTGEPRRLFAEFDRAIDELGIPHY